MELRDISTAARIELLEPLPQRPSRRYLLQLATSNLQSYMNRLSNTGRPWAVSETLLVVSPNVNEYLMPVSDIAKVMDVTTVAEGNDYHIERQIPFWDLNDLRVDWNAPPNIPAITFYDSHHTAQRIAFSRKDWQDAVYATVWPIPQFTCSYRVLYGVKGSAPTMSLDDSPIITQHHFLLSTKTALDALPGSAWWSDEQQNRLRRNELAASLGNRLPDLLKQYDIFVRSMTTRRMTRRLTYAID
jgi:hypothetical protein